MKLLFTLSLFLFFSNLLEAEGKRVYTFSQHAKPLPVSEKKRKFYALLLPPTEKTYKKLYAEFIRIKEAAQKGEQSEEIERLQRLYKVTNNRDLLLALKPHPISITLAQAAIESAWGTSRFFREANNVFGMWSKNSHDARIAAAEKRNGKRTIWLRKFDTIEESVQAYYKTLGRANAYRKFRKLRYESDDVYKIIKGLNKYSEMGDAYVKILETLIWHNNLTKYDIK
jgi:Bax protein